MKEGDINAAQIFRQKMPNKRSGFTVCTQIMAETCRKKNNYACAIYYWKSVRALSSQDAHANLALIELYKKIDDTKMLNQEIRLLFYWQGSLKLNEYIQQLNKDENLNIYVPRIENFSFITKKCFHIN